MKPAAVDHSATRCRERRLFTNARIEWIAAIRYAATAANSKDRIGKLGENIVSDLRSSAESAAKNFSLCFGRASCRVSGSKKGSRSPENGSGASSARFLQEPGSREKH